MRSILLPIVHGLRAVNRAIEGVLNPISTVLTMMMLGTVVWTVVARLSGISAPWTEKVMLILLPTLAFTVAPVAYRRGANVALDLLHDAFPPRVQRLHSLLLHLFILLLLMVALDLTLRKIGVNPAPLTATIEAVTGLDLSAIRPFKAKMKIPVLGIQWRTVYTVMPIGVAAMIIVNFEMLARCLLGLFRPDDPEVRPVRTFEDSIAYGGE